MEESSDTNPIPRSANRKKQNRWEPWRFPLRVMILSLMKSIEETDIVCWYCAEIDRFSCHCFAHLHELFLLLLFRSSSFSPLLLLHHCCCCIDPKIAAVNSLAVVVVSLLCRRRFWRFSSLLSFLLAVAVVVVVWLVLLNWNCCRHCRCYFAAIKL